MALRRWTRTRLKIVAVVALVGGGVGVVISWLLSHIHDHAYDLAELENGLRIGLMLGAALSAVDLFYVQGPRGAWLRRLGFGRAILARTGLFTALIAAMFALNRLIFGLLHGFERSGLDYFGQPWLRDTLLSFAVFLVITEFLQMRRVIGGRTLTNLMLGRYHRPVREERVFMLVDIKGSTALAERSGDEHAHAVIASVFFDIDQPILEHGAEVYGYVGDELIASWPLEQGVRDARCLRCLEAIERTLAARAGHYRAAFGVTPAVRIVLHAGPIVAGECGDAKLSIVYLGDTLNTAARMEEAAKSLGRDWLISDDLLARLDLPPSLSADPLGPIALRGRTQPIALHALRPAATMVQAAAE
ncbi:MAG TPA: adenylate/guanylate cyclase domain-containing protein [Geminicoccaceae bacterium]|nr:adenylate/guanylate cyclase domain-containing protein [Geminicoccaceae bacterium]